MNTEIIRKMGTQTMTAPAGRPVTRRSDMTSKAGNDPYNLRGFRAAHVSHYNMCRVHEALRTTPAVALGIADRVWTIGDLIDAALATLPVEPVSIVGKRLLYRDSSVA
jgi:hypothetical protein